LQRDLLRCREHRRRGIPDGHGHIQVGDSEAQAGRGAESVQKETEAAARSLRTARQEAVRGQKCACRKERVNEDRALMRERGEGTTMITGRLKSVLRPIWLVAIVAALAVASGAGSASAAAQCSSCTPWWRLTSGSLPRNLPPGGEGTISLLAENDGDAGVNTPVTLNDKLPAGLTAQRVS